MRCILLPNTPICFSLSSGSDLFEDGSPLRVLRNMSYLLTTSLVLHFSARSIYRNNKSLERHQTCLFLDNSSEFVSASLSRVVRNERPRFDSFVSPYTSQIHMKIIFNLIIQRWSELIRELRNKNSNYYGSKAFVEAAFWHVHTPYALDPFWLRTCW